MLASTQALGAPWHCLGSVLRRQACLRGRRQAGPAERPQIGEPFSLYVVGCARKSRWVCVAIKVAYSRPSGQLNAVGRRSEYRVQVQVQVQVSLPGAGRLAHRQFPPCCLQIPEFPLPGSCNGGVASCWCWCAAAPAAVPPAAAVLPVTGAPPPAATAAGTAAVAGGAAAARWLLFAATAVAACACTISSCCSASCHCPLELLLPLLYMLILLLVGRLHAALAC